MRLPPLWQLTLYIALVSSLVLYFALGSTYAPIKILRAKPKDPVAEEENSHAFYPWQTTTSFPTLPSALLSGDADVETLCAHFPSHKLQSIQPVLKTGHATLDRVRTSLRSTSACLHNLLIVSDLDETVDNHTVIDVIKDYPLQMLVSDEAWNQTEAYRQLRALAAKGNLEHANLTAINGWEIDKFKFLPAVARVWREAPRKEWYVFYEGDTYVVWDAVFRLLEHFDPDLPHYFGSPSPGREEIWFANGGPGYILSREAVWRLVADDYDRSGSNWIGPNFLKKHWQDVLSDCCGDSILGWTLHVANVQLKGLWPMFNPHPLHGVPFSDRYWCQPVLSMHKTLLEQELSFWKFEWPARQVDPERPILYRDVAASFFDISGRNFTHVRMDWDNADWDSFLAPGDDSLYIEDPHASHHSCALACSAIDNCFQWTYHERECWMVRSIRVGASKPPSMAKEGSDSTSEDHRYVAGWDTSRIRAWMYERPCESVQWVTPSTERIF